MLSGRGLCRPCGFKKGQKTMMERYGVSSLLSIASVRDYVKNCTSLRKGVVCGRPANYKAGVTRYCFQCKPEACTSNKVSLAVARPDLVPFWSAKNLPTAHDVSFCSIFVAQWSCKKGHSWILAVNLQRQRKGSCQHCHNRVPTPEYSLLALFPDVASELVDEMVNPAVILPHADVVQHSFRTCPLCCSFRFLFPKLTTYWDMDQNGPLPVHLKPGVNDKKWWLCEKGHSYERCVRDVVRKNGQGCPQCPKVRLLLENVENNCPELFIEWHPTLNGQLEPKYVSPRSLMKVWWVCENNHSFLRSVASRQKGNGCPRCTSTRSNATELYNITVTHSLVAAEWDWENNTQSPKEYTPGSEVLVWWICPQGHHYQNSIYRRCRNGSSCVLCKGSHGERQVQAYLTSAGFVEFCDQNKSIAYYKREHRFPGCRVKRELPFDFYIHVRDGLFACVEFQGKQHFEPIPFFGGEEAFQKRLSHDGIKAKFCAENDIPLCVISYSEIEKVPEILGEFLASLTAGSAIESA